MRETAAADGDGSGTGGRQLFSANNPPVSEAVVWILKNLLITNKKINA
jgi:hypothetical protein